MRSIHGRDIGTDAGDGSAPACLMVAWSMHEMELRGYLRHRLDEPQDADDVLHESFIKILRRGRRFCVVVDQRAWLFQVIRNALADRLRARHEHLALPEAFPAPTEALLAPVDALAQCLPRALAELSEADRIALTFCDIEGQSRQRLADRLGISLPGAKSRLKRARARLRQHLIEACHVRFDDEGRVCCFVSGDTVVPDRRGLVAEPARQPANDHRRLHPFATSFVSVSVNVDSEPIDDRDSESGEHH
ncbi:sigma-70 family RNA polymerase sigma factor [Thiocapsa sp.]|uniref:sigma-70 family RNA polymerase sigma factor n=1 Tax=Thiocapsa sp. TaxID=2024551 RepID=UPI003594582E